MNIEGIGPTLLGKKLGFFMLCHNDGNKKEISAEMLCHWFDWRVNIFGRAFTLWFEFVDAEEEDDGGDPFLHESED